MSKEGDQEDQDEKINNAIKDVLDQSKKEENKSRLQEVNIYGTIIYIIPVKLLGHDGDGLYFVHPSSEIHGKHSKSQKPQYSTAYVIPQNPIKPGDYTNINYIDVPIAYRGNRIASKLLEAVEQWCKGQHGFTLIRLENDTDINQTTGLPSTLYEKAGYHYLNKDITDEFNGKKRIRSGGNEMEKLLRCGNHSEYCQFGNGSIVASEHEDESKAEELVCKKSEMKKRNHWIHIDLKNIIGNINATVLRSGKTVAKAPANFRRRVKGIRSRSNKIYQSKVKPKRSRSKVKGKRSRSRVRTNTKNKSRRVKV